MILELEERLLRLIDDTVEQGSDDDLFAGGYLRGHITMAVAEAETAGESEPDVLFQRIRLSLEKAFKQGELSPQDQALVNNFWLLLYQRACEE